MVKGFSKLRTKLTSMNRERVMKTRILITLLLLGTSATLVLGGDPPAELKYAKRATRAETRKAREFDSRRPSPGPITARGSTSRARPCISPAMTRSSSRAKNSW